MTENNKKAIVINYNSLINKPDVVVDEIINTSQMIVSEKLRLSAIGVVRTKDSLRKTKVKLLRTEILTSLRLVIKKPHRLFSLSTIKIIASWIRQIRNV